MINPIHLAEIVGRITIWYSSLRTPKPSYFNCAELTQGTGYSMSQLRLPLAMLDWSRTEVWQRIDGKRVRRVFYAPPGHHVPRPNRGRPSTRFDYFYDGINHF